MNKLLLIIVCLGCCLPAFSQTVDFNFESSSGSFCSPSVISFKQACTGNPKSFLWDFGNGKFGNKPNETVTYKSPGTYTVKLTAVFATTTLKISKTVVVNAAVKASISATNTALCKPDSVTFTATGGSNYEWNFGDGSAAVTTTSGTITHVYNRFANFRVTLKAISAAGCSDTTSIPVNIKAFPIAVNLSSVRGCIPAPINFTGVPSLPPNSTAVSYTWDFGDGSTVYQSTGNTASHTYAAVGSYYPKVTVVTSEGCTNSYTLFNPVYFGTPPTNLVVYSLKDSACGSDSVVFISKATNSNRYYWDFGDGTNLSASDTIVKHKFASVGNKVVRVNPYFNECVSPSKAINFKVIGVIAKNTFTNSCTDKNIFSFRDSGSGIPTGRLWDFGDGSAQVSTASPVHTFPVTGQFKTILIVDDAVSGCADTSTKIVYTAQPKLTVTDSAICRRDSMRFVLINNYADTSLRYLWNVPDSVTGPVTNTSLTVAAPVTGLFNGSLIIVHGQGFCSDTLTLAQPLQVRGPRLNFSVPAEICLNSPLALVNNSTPFNAADPVSSWQWDFGNGITDTAFQPQYQYDSDGTYNIQLQATDNAGCSDTLTKTVQIDPVPFITISATRPVICFGESDSLSALHNDNLVWSPAGSVPCNSCDTIFITPKATTLYYGTVTNSFGCSVKDSVQIEVSVPFQAVISPAEIKICPDDTATLHVTPVGKRVLWSPSEGLSDASAYNPRVAVNRSTEFTATLSDSIGCPNTSSAKVNVHVKPSPTVDAGPDQIFSKGSNFTIQPKYSSDVRSYDWSPAATLSCSSCATPSGVANANQRYVIKVTSDSGCVSSDSLLVGIDCRNSRIDMPKAFTPNNDSHNDVYYPLTTDIQSITRFTIYNRAGKVMFEAHNFLPNDRSFGWNGKYRGIDQPQGGYVYTIETICIIGEKISKTGSFLLIR